MNLNFILQYGQKENLPDEEAKFQGMVTILAYPEISTGTVRFATKDLTQNGKPEQAKELYLSTNEMRLLGNSLILAANYLEGAR